VVNLVDEYKFHIIGHQLCPYVQRVVILMQEKQIAYLRTDIELHNKPEWLKKLTPTGKVPILVVNENKALFESSVICEYLDEVSHGSLHPDDMLDKATHRAWIAYGTEILDCIAKIIYRDKTYKCVETTLAEIADLFCVVEQELSGEKYFSGSQFHIVDAVYATIFRYFDVLGELTTLDLFSKLSKIRKWKDALLQRASVQNAVPGNYNELLVKFIKRRNSFISYSLDA